MTHAQTRDVDDEPHHNAVASKPRDNAISWRYGSALLRRAANEEFLESAVNFFGNRFARLWGIAQLDVFRCFRSVFLGE
jgi:hypothetical protein